MIRPLSRRGGEARSEPGRLRPLAETALRLIWKEREISRAEIARRVDVSRSTVSEAVSLLLPKGLVAEVGRGPSRGGRRPIVLRFQDDANTILGIEMGASHVQVALTNLRGRLLDWEHVDHPVREDPEGTRHIVREASEAVLRRAGSSRSRLIGVGLAVPCPIDPSHPDGLSELVMPAWKGKLGLDDLGSRLGVPMRVDNDANLGALSELWWGAARGVENFAYVKIATGLGSGHVIGGEIYRGATGVAGEIGHLAMDPHGEECICGLRGCLATLVGTAALVRRAEARLADHPESVLFGTRPTIVSLEDAALAGDALALGVVQEAAGHLGAAIAGLVNLLNPSMVVLGGGLTRVGDILLGPLRETASSRSLASSLSASAIRVSELGPHAISIGAATLVLRDALADSRLFVAASRRRKSA